MKKEIPANPLRRNFLKWISLISSSSLLQFFIPLKSWAGGFVAFSFFKKNIPTKIIDLKNVSLLLTGEGTAGLSNSSFLDSSSNNLTLTPTGNVTQGSFGPFGSNWSVFFNGTTDYLSIADSTNLQFGSGDFTIEFWWHPKMLTGIQEIVTKGWGLQIFASDTTIMAALSASNNGSYFISSLPFGTLKNGQWNHIALSKSGNNYYGYLNGSSTLLGNSTSVIGSGSSALIIGGFYNSSYYYFTSGYISNLRILKGTALYTGATISLPTSNLTAVTNTVLLTCQSSSFIDTSSSIAAITLGGSPAVCRFNPHPIYSALDGGSVYFDGSGDYISCPYTTAKFDWWSSDFTIECWVYPITLSSFQYLSNVSTYISNMVGNMGPTDTVNYWSFGPIANGTVRFYYYNGSPNYVDSTLTINAKQWSHLAMTKTSSGITLWVNGKASSTTTISGTPQSSASYNFVMGQTQNTSCNGYLSGLRLVKGTAIYTANFSPPTAALTNITNTNLLCHFNNGGVVDLAGQNNLTMSGTPQISTAQKKYGLGYIYFDGSTDYMTLPSTFLPGDFTIEMWVNPTSGQPFPAILTNYNSTTWSQTGSFGIYIGHSGVGGDSTHYLIAFEGVFPKIKSTSAIAFGSWTHLAMVRSGSTITMYINGVSESSFTSTSHLCLNQNTWWIGTGGYTPNNSDEYKGYLDDLRITNGIARYTGASFTVPSQF
jgi:hypothetical protein